MLMLFGKLPYQCPKRWCDRTCAYLPGNASRLVNLSLRASRSSSRPSKTVRLFTFKHIHHQYRYIIDIETFNYSDEEVAPLSTVQV